jgi:hypothetical protein
MAMHSEQHKYLLLWMKRKRVTDRFRKGMLKRRNKKLQENVSQPTREQSSSENSEK